MNNNKKFEDASKRPMNRNTMDDDVIIEGTASNSPATSVMSNPGTPRPDLDMHGNHGTPPPPMTKPQQIPALSQHPQTKYTQLLAVIEDMGLASGENDEEDTLEVDKILPNSVGPYVSGSSWSQRLPPSFSQQLDVTLSLQKTPTKSPTNSATSSPKTSEKDEEAARREKLQQKLALEEQKKAEKLKKKRKLAL